MAKVDKIASQTPSKEAQEILKTKKEASSLIAKTLQKHQNLKEDPVQNTSEKLLEFNNLTQKNYSPDEYSGIDSLSLAKIKQNMNLLHGDWNLADLDYQLSAESLEYRYSQDQARKSEMPQRISPYK
mgnify:CR=1 FL=1